MEALRLRVDSLTAAFDGALTLCDCIVRHETRGADARRTPPAAPNATTQLASAHACRRNTLRRTRVESAR